MKRTIETKFYTFRQNNSGGSFVTDKENGICEYVCIEALNADDANSRAEQKGIYFDGCDDGRDCSCCGDRWYRTDDDEGHEVPTLYGTPIEDVEKDWYKNKAFIHYMDGAIGEIEFKEKSEK